MGWEEIPKVTPFAAVEGLAGWWPFELAARLMPLVFYNVTKLIMTSQCLYRMNIKDFVGVLIKHGGPSHNFKVCFVLCMRLVIVY